MAVRVTEVIGEILFAGKFPVLLGGEHSLTFGAVAAVLKLPLDGELTIVQLDAHTDLRNSYCNTKWGHGCVARRMSEQPGVKIVQVGLRSTSQEEYSSVPSNVTQFWCEDVLNDFPGTLEKVLAACSDNVYLTFDVDQTGRVSNPQPSQPHRARRFTRADATTVAACIKNGNGAAGEVVHVRQAIAESLEGQRFLLSRLQEHNINTTPEQYSIDIK